MIPPDATRDTLSQSGGSDGFALHRRQWFDLAIGSPIWPLRMLKIAGISKATPLNSEYCRKRRLFSASVNQMRFCLVVTGEVVDGAE
jgi:hypothetical protein